MAYGSPCLVSRPRELEIKSLVKQICQSTSSTRGSHVVQGALAFALDTDNARILIVALIEALDTFASHSVVIYNCLVVIKGCMMHGPPSFIETVRPFAPEIRLVTLLTFEGSKCQNRSKIHALALSIYYCLIRRTLEHSEQIIEPENPIEGASARPRYLSAHEANRIAQSRQSAQPTFTMEIAEALCRDLPSDDPFADFEVLPFSLDLAIATDRFEFPPIAHRRPRNRLQVSSGPRENTRDVIHHHIEPGTVQRRRSGSFSGCLDEAQQTGDHFWLTKGGPGTKTTERLPSE
jgi:hypothetical protein